MTEKCAYRHEIAKRIIGENGLRTCQVYSRACGKTAKHWATVGKRRVWYCKKHHIEVKGSLYSPYHHRKVEALQSKVRWEHYRHLVGED